MFQWNISCLSMYRFNRNAQKCGRDFEMFLLPLTSTGMSSPAERMKRCKETPETIILKKFISESDFSVDGDYRSSWKFIKEYKHSLERHTNLGLCFPDVSKPPLSGSHWCPVPRSGVHYGTPLLKATEISRFARTFSGHFRQGCK